MIVDESAITISGLIAEIEELKAQNEKLKIIPALLNNSFKSSEFIQYLYVEAFELGKRFDDDMDINMEMWILWNEFEKQYKPCSCENRKKGFRCSQGKGCRVGENK